MSGCSLPGFETCLFCVLFPSPRSPADVGTIKDGDERRRSGDCFSHHWEGNRRSRRSTAMIKIKPAKTGNTGDGRQLRPTSNCRIFVQITHFIIVNWGFVRTSAAAGMRPDCCAPPGCLFTTPWRQKQNRCCQNQNRWKSGGNSQRTAQQPPSSLLSSGRDIRCEHSHLL